VIFAHPRGGLGRGPALKRSKRNSKNLRIGGRRVGGGNIPAEQIRFARALGPSLRTIKIRAGGALAGGTLKNADKIAWRGLFDERHEQAVRHPRRDQKVEIVNYHLTREG
jgi:hypothetical protein